MYVIVDMPGQKKQLSRSRRMMDGNDFLTVVSCSCLTFFIYLLALWDIIAIGTSLHHTQLHLLYQNEHKTYRNSGSGRYLPLSATTSPSDPVCILIELDMAISNTSA